MLSPEYSAFNFWKPSFPDINVELSGFLHNSNAMDVSNKDSFPSKTQQTSTAENALDPEFNSFHFWREPIQQIDVDLAL